MIEKLNKLSLLIISLFLINILILVLTAILRMQYVLFHISEIALFTFFIYLVVKIWTTEQISQSKLVFFLYTGTLSYSVIWLSIVLFIGRIQTEIQRDLFYAALMIIFFTAMVIIAVFSFKEIFQIRYQIKFNYRIIFTSFLIVGVYFLISSMLLSPQEDISEFFYKINSILS